MFRSLRLRIALSHAIVLIVILIALGVGLQLILARSLDGAATRDITGIARGQIARIEEAGHAVAPVDSDVPSSADVQVGVWTPDGALRGEASETPGWLERYGATVTDLTVEGEPVRVVTLPARVDGRTLAWVAAGRSLKAEAELLRHVRLILLVGGALAALASLLAGWWLAGRAVRPVQAAYEAQAGFAADASHELRTPLAFIRSGVEVLAEGQPQLGAQVLDEVDYLTALTARLLTLARAEGEVRLRVEPVEVGKACRSSAERSRRVHGNDLTIRGEEAMVLADPVALEAVLDAVLENVARHGGHAAEISWCRQGPDVTVSVADRGPGLPEELRGKAFERFFRADPSRARETGGAGLGLALAHALVRAQGGQMWLDPTEGHGLTVRAMLPTA